MASSFEQSTSILLIEPDDDTRPLLVKNLRQRGFHVIVTVDPQDAAEWVNRDGQQPQIILCNQVRQSIEGCIQVADSIRQDLPQPLQTRIVIMAEDYDPDLEGQNVDKGNGIYITYLEYAQQLFDLLTQIAPQS